MSKIFLLSKFEIICSFGCRSPNDSLGFIRGKPAMVAMAIIFVAVTIVAIVIIVVAGRIITVAITI